MIERRNLARFIDHTLLKAEATPEEISTLCRQALDFGFAAVCVNSCYASLCANFLEGSAVRVCTVAGFPLGACLSEVKAYEAESAVKNGAQEIDMVMNIGRLKAGDYDYVRADIKDVVDAVGEDVVIKVILETCLLDDEEKKRACLIAKEAGAHFVKTSTGFSKAGATVADVMLMRKTVGKEMGVKAAGGIRDFETAVSMIEAGANRIGTSSGVSIVRESDEDHHDDCV